jgi:N-methylhydantoinase A/oxoprolinase/acetone carboxylase beta subunit
MERAVRAVSVERGVDPRGLALVAFGGAGPLHACAIADALGMPAVIIPPRAGVASAVGLLCSPRRQEVVQSAPADPAEVAARAVARVGVGADVEIAYDCRYVGQSHELTVADPGDFPAEHERRNGHARPGAPVEVVAVRARAQIAAPLAVTDLPPVTRTRVRGPAVVAEPDCTVWIPEGWVAVPGALGAWLVKRT